MAPQGVSSLSGMAPLCLLFSAAPYTPSSISSRTVTSASDHPLPPTTDLKLCTANENHFEAHRSFNSKFLRRNTRIISALICIRRTGERRGAIQFFNSHCWQQELTNFSFSILSILSFPGTNRKQEVQAGDAGIFHCWYWPIS